MKKLKSLGIIFFILSIFISSIYVYVNIINADLYGRLIETLPYSEQENKDIPTITLILNNYISEENTIESNVILQNSRTSSFINNQNDTLRYTIIISDGYYYNPSGVFTKFEFTDIKNTNNFGYLNYGYKSDSFSIPTSSSIDGFPFDEINFYPNISLYINGKSIAHNLNIQKRIAGKRISFSEDYKNIIKLSRTSIEKWMVIISSFIFILLSTLLVYVLVTSNKTLNTIEEIITVAGYLIATAGFREILGINRENGTATIEIIVILIPLTCVFTGIIFSFFKGIKTTANTS